MRRLHLDPEPSLAVLAGVPDLAAARRDLHRLWRMAPDWRRAVPDLLRAPVAGFDELRTALLAARERPLGSPLGSPADVRLLPAPAEAFPARLAAIPDPPACLFVRGCERLLSAPAAVAVVGSRRPTISGREQAGRLAHDLARLGIVIVSGLAFGVDAAAHRGALAAGGATIAVLGAGIDRVYPAAHETLAGEIVAADGALVTEYSPGTPPARHRFPERNRIISGLTLGVVVVEAAKRSGSLITARMAAEQGRDVMAVPGSPVNPMSHGCLTLLRDGAALIRGADDVLEALCLELDRAAHGARQAPLPADPAAREVLAALGEREVSVDALIEHTGRPAAEVLAALATLEVEGFVATSADGYSRRP